MNKKLLKSILISMIIVTFLNIIGQMNGISYLGGLIYQFIVSEYIYKDNGNNDRR